MSVIVSAPKPGKLESSYTKTKFNVGQNQNFCEPKVVEQTWETKHSCKYLWFHVNF